jgi:hypothetical protein
MRPELVGPRCFFTVDVDVTNLFDLRVSEVASRRRLPSGSSERACCATAALALDEDQQRRRALTAASPRVNATGCARVRIRPMLACFSGVGETVFKPRGSGPDRSAAGPHPPLEDCGRSRRKKSGPETVKRSDI